MKATGTNFQDNIGLFFAGTLLMLSRQVSQFIVRAVVGATYV